MKSELRLALLFAVLLCLGLAEIASAATVSSPATTPPAPKPTSWAETNAEPLNHSPALKIDVLLIADANDYAGNGWEKDFAGDVGALLGKAFAGDYAQLYALFEFRLARHGGSAGTNCAMEMDATSSGSTLGDLARRYSYGVHYDAVGIIHKHGGSDCFTANGTSIFTAKVDKPLTFLHELGHAAFGLADEYVGAPSFWEIPASYGPSNMWHDEEKCKIAETGSMTWEGAGEETTGKTPWVPAGTSQCKKLEEKGYDQLSHTWYHVSDFYHSTPKSGLFASGLLMERSGSNVPAYGEIIARAIAQRIEWGRQQCNKANIGCAQLAKHNQDEIRDQAAGAAHYQAAFASEGTISSLLPRAVVLKYHIDADGNITSVGEPQLVDSYAPGRLLSAAPFWQYTAKTEGGDILDQQYIWDPRLVLAESENAEGELTGEMLILKDVNFEVVLDKPDYADLSAVQFAYPRLANRFPVDPDQWLRPKPLPIESLPSTCVIGIPEQLQRRDFGVIDPVGPETYEEMATFIQGQVVEPLVGYAETTPAAEQPAASYGVSPLRLGDAAALAALSAVTQQQIVHNSSVFQYPQPRFGFLPNLPASEPHDVDQGLEPRLASSWDANDDLSQWTLHLVEGKTFHDGASFDAEAVIANFKRWQTRQTELESVWSTIEDVKIERLDGHTVRFVLPASDPLFLRRLANPLFGIHSPPAMLKADLSGVPYGSPAAGVVGTGPYRWQWARGNRVLLSKVAPSGSEPQAGDGSGACDGAHPPDELMFRYTPPDFVQSPDFRPEYYGILELPQAIERGVDFLNWSKPENGLIIKDQLQAIGQDDNGNWKALLKTLVNQANQAGAP
ncbi:MAG: hypothetical protein K1X65_24045 [Caldilineales bacterium]|nr:hypothetical protein [Caldilineales bacterium]